MNCWDFMKCGRTPGGDKVNELGVCPAYPDNGRHCAHVAGSLSGNGRQGTHARIIPSCWICDFYRSEHYMKHQPVGAR